MVQEWFAPVVDAPHSTVLLAVCSAGNAEMVKKLGADRVLDYAVDDFTRANEKYDVIMDTVGSCSFATCAPVMADGGRLLLVAADLSQLLGALLRPSRSGKRVMAGNAPQRAEDLRLLGELAEAGKFRPFIDRSFPFERIAEAHAYVETHRKKGNVVVML